MLVVVPEHLAFQWMAELFHKFNALFTLLSADRIAALGGPEAALSQSKLAILSQEQLASDPGIAAAAAGLEFLGGCSRKLSSGGGALDGGAHR